ncbi:C40 family peptidase [Mangrovimonas spongiae]|uniref:NlpC/P60 family protein n=1 Tax=Mangrovimonas spongiae TaxID=2494697 RepID=A0A3R9MH03_9FLAO|nr:C40 family peptidase [Mangrovimonas spongiae]RSK41943.1 NlpC/P60 family protein [Mangrovimonas spongiae]
MKKTFYLLCIAVLTLVSCKSTKGTKVVTKKSKQTTTKNSSSEPTTVSSKTYSSSTHANTTINNIIAEAETYHGVRYKYGGNTKRGMDCSGLVTTAFKSEDILLPRTTSSLSTHGDWIDLKNVQKGDLLFFATKKNSRKVNHVGIVTNTRPGYVEFIHSTTSRGVITSKLSEKYWYFAFVQARRVL